MSFARTAALLTSIFSAGVTVGYGSLPAKTARGISARMGLGAAAHRTADRAVAAGGGDAAKAAADAESFGPESRELRALRSPEFEMLGADERETARPQTSAPASVCGTGVDRRICSAEESSDGGADGRWLVGMRAPELAVHPSLRGERFFRYLTASTEGRKLFRAWLKHSGRYHDTVARSLHDRGMPEDLEAVVFVESGYSPTAVSTEGAAGLWQFMPGTARLYGLAVDRDYDERRNVEKSTEAATRYLADLYERFGSWELALAAYDMGYGRLTHRVQELSTNDYWTLSKVPGALPDEALSYVPKVLAVALLLKNLDRFGFEDAPTDDPVAASDLSVPSGTPLSLVARAAGTSVDTIRGLNPSILGGIVPDRGVELPLRVPARGLARANTMLPRLLSHMRVDDGDDRVGDGFDWGIDELAPKRRASSSRANSFWDDRPAPGLPLSPDAPDPEDDESAAADNGRTIVFYRVQDGDTLPAIAREFGARASRIVRDNHLDPVAKLQKGMVLQLRVPRSSVSRLASQRPLDGDDDDARPPPLPSPRIDRAPDPEGAPAPPSPANPPAPARRLHGGHASSTPSVVGFPGLFAKAKR